MPAASSVSIGARTVQLYTFTGEVTHSAVSSETERTVDQHNRHVSSRTWHHNQLMVQAADGEVREIDVGSAKVAVAPGQVVTLCWGIVNGREKGDYVAVHNHATRQTGWFAKGVNDVAGPPGYNMLLIVLVFVVVFNFLGVFRFEPTAIFWVAIGLGAFWWLLQRRKKLRAAVEQSLGMVDAQAAAMRMA